MTDAGLKGPRSELGEILHHLVRDPLGLAGLIIVTVIVASAAFAPWIAPYDPIALNVPDRLQGPGGAHLLGTDQLGRDTFSRVIWGGASPCRSRCRRSEVRSSSGCFLG